MREILFRGKNIYNDWIYGYLCQHRGEPVMDNNGMVLEGSDYYIRDWAEKIDTGFYGCNYRVDPSTIGQYTGLTDKDDRKIFEGDIVNILAIDKNRVVRFDEGGFCLDAGSLRDYRCFGKMAIKVIGIIHDNPELLEVTE